MLAHRNFAVDLQLEAFNGYVQLGNAYFSKIEADAAILGIDLSTPETVPEPSTLLLLGTGALFGLLVAKLRRHPPFEIPESWASGQPVAQAA
jgi:hypothetical protein